MRKVHMLSCFVGALLVVLSARADELKFVEVVGGANADEGYEVVQTSDNGYVLVGKTDSYGAGGYDIIVTRFDSLGGHMWTTVIGGTGYDGAASVAETYDGGLVIGGSTNSYGAGGVDALLGKLDGSGRLLWMQTVGGPSDDWASTVIQTADSGLSFTGSTFSFGEGGRDAWVVQMDSLGEVFQTTTMGWWEWEDAADMVQTSDGGYAVIGGSYSIDNPDLAIVLWRLDASGNHLWSRNVGAAWPQGGDRGSGIVETSDGGLVFTAHSEMYSAGGGPDLMLGKFDAAGTYLWSTTWGGVLTDYANAVAQTVEGGFLVTGMTDSYGAGSTDMILSRFDHSGNHIWSRTIGGTNIDYCARLKSTYDNGFVIAGHTQGFSAQSTDMVLMKCNSDGVTCLGDTLLPAVSMPSPGVGTDAPAIAHPAVTVHAWTPDVENPVPDTHEVCWAYGPVAAHIYPDAGLREGSMTAHVYGGNFRGALIPSARLVRTGEPDIIGTSVDVVTPSYFTCSFDLAGAPLGLYGLASETGLGTDTLPGCFTIYRRSPDPYRWDMGLVSSTPDDIVLDVVLGDADGDEKLELYGTCGDGYVYQFTWEDSIWSETIVGSGGDMFWGVAVGDCDGDDESEVYATNWDGNLYQFTWEDTVWTPAIVDSELSMLMGIELADVDGDGELEIFVGGNGVVDQYTWDGEVWVRTTIGSGGTMMDVAAADCDGDGRVEVYVASDDGNVYRFVLEDSGWVQTVIGFGEEMLWGIGAGDGNADGEPEVYAVGFDGNTYQFKYEGGTWVQTTIYSMGVRDEAFAVTVGDGDGDGELEVYSADVNGDVHQLKWDGSSWAETTIGSGSEVYGLAVGDGNNDGQMEIYGADGTGVVFHYHVVAVPVMALSDTTHDFGPVALGDSAAWEYLVIRSVGSDTLVVDSIASDTPDFRVSAPVLSDTMPPGDSILVTVEFRPSVLDTTSGTLTVFSDDPASPETGISLVGIGVDGTPPEPFSLISPADGEILPNARPVFSWEESFDSLTGLATYEVYIDDTLRHTCPDTEPVWYSGYDLPEGYHEWYIIAYDSAGNPRQSNETWRVGVDLTGPAAVQLISPADGAYQSQGAADLVWHHTDDNLSGVDHYVLHYALDTLFSPALVETSTMDTSYGASFSDTTYYWRVTAVDSMGHSGDWSFVWRFTVDRISPLPPVPVGPVGGLFLTDTLVDFEWSEVTFLAGRPAGRELPKEESQAEFAAPVWYELEVDTLGDFVFPVCRDTFDTTSGRLVLNDHLYWWRVKAFDLAGNESPHSDVDSFGVDVSPPAFESTTVWPDTSYSGPFTVYSKITDLGGVDSAVLCFKRYEDPAWFHSDMMEGTGNWYYGEIPWVSMVDDTVKYYVRAEDPWGHGSTDPPGAPASYFSFIANTTGIQELTAPIRDFSFALQSNPTRCMARFSLVLPEEANVTLKIYDTSGRLIEVLLSGRTASGTHHISWTSEAGAGVYFYRLESRWRNEVGKIVLLR